MPRYAGYALDIDRTLSRDAPPLGNRLRRQTAERLRQSGITSDDGLCFFESRIFHNRRKAYLSRECKVIWDK